MFLTPSFLINADPTMFHIHIIMVNIMPHPIIRSYMLPFFLFFRIFSWSYPFVEPWFLPSPLHLSNIIWDFTRSHTFFSSVTPSWASLVEAVLFHGSFLSYCSDSHFVELLICIFLIFFDLLLNFDCRLSYYSMWISFDLWDSAHSLQAYYLFEPMLSYLWFKF